jgi:NADH:ubiquinone oxidoreductase subunit H
MIIITIVSITVPVLLVVAFMTLTERQVMASMQKRMGPQVSGVGGLLQPFYDGIKLALKEPIMPESASTGAFSAAPMIAFIISQISLAVIFVSDGAYQGLVLMALSTLAVYGVLLAGWASNSKYGLLGCLRSVSLMVSYELGFGAMLLSVSLFITDGTGVKSLNFSEASPMPLVALAPILGLFIVCILAESKRIPFDLPEAEAELVAGYNVEYSSLGFALFFIAEYANLAILSAIASVYFCGGLSALKIIAIIFVFVWVRGTLPRYRADQFMRIGWKALLPMSLAMFSMYAAFDYIC